MSVVWQQPPISVNTTLWLDAVVKVVVSEVTVAVVVVVVV